VHRVGGCHPGVVMLVWYQVTAAAAAPWWCSRLT
jgi:hypothetical protein